MIKALSAFLRIGSHFGFIGEVYLFSFNFLIYEKETIPAYKGGLRTNRKSNNKLMAYISHNMLVL